MGRQLLDSLVRQGMHGEQVRVQCYAELRYRGQFHQIAVPIADPDGGPAMLGRLTELFHAEHLRLYTYESSDEALQLVNLRARATGLVDRPELRSLDPGGAEAALVGSRPVRFRGTGEAVACSVYARERLGAGATITGPAVIEEYTSASLVPPGFTAEIDDFGNILLRRPA
jgi:N-methylhydantoinase A